MVQKKVIVSMRDNEPREVYHNWIYLHVEVPEHIIAVPVANQIDDTAVYSL